jgi:class 3 adenylate cyclase/tetratricopeptide (TPR) repeat protein
MTCGRCGTENAAGRRFCASCGESFPRSCPRCRFVNEPLDHFCGGCGAALESPPPGGNPAAYTPKHLSERVLTTRSALEGERKWVTVLFCDVVDSYRLAEQLGAEGMHEIMDQALRLMAEAVHRYEGTVNQFLGDGLMALFGAPLALEQHALSGIYAALAIREALRAFNQSPANRGGQPLRVRMGLNSGFVVVGRIGDDLRMDYTAVGDTTHLAARLQALADPDDILISDTTAGLAEGYIRLESLGPLAIRGRSESVVAHRVTGVRSSRSRFQVAAERGLTPFVGRARDLDLLKQRFALARSGHGQVVSVVGEAGVGKSRLLHEFRRELRAETFTWLEGQCSASGQAVPYQPILHGLRTSFRIDNDDSGPQIREKIRFGVRRLGLDPDPAVPVLETLFGLEVSGAALQRLDPRMRRQRIFETIQALTVAGTRVRPLVVVVEDLHWIDTTSEEYLVQLVAGLAGMPLLLLTTSRPGYDLPWADQPYSAQVGLDLLEPLQVSAMVTNLLGVSETPADLAAVIWGKAEGNPLFVEEIVRSMLERGVLRRDAERVRWAGTANVDFPARIQDIVSARFDRLEEPVRRTLQVGAVSGRHFRMRVLSRVAEIPEEVAAHVEALKRAELVHETQFFPELEYTFNHAIFQEVAYQSLLAPRRRQLHRLIGEALEEMASPAVSEHCNELAYHFSRADVADKAVKYLIDAGDRAAAAFSNREALALYHRALELRQGGGRTTEAELLHKLGTVSLLVGDAAASLRYVEGALEVYEALGDKRNVLRMHLDISRLSTDGYGDAAQEDRARRHLEAVAASVETDADSLEKGLIYQRAAHLYLHRGQPSASLDWAHRAVDLFARLKIPMGTSLGTILSYTGRVDEGVAYNERNWEAVVTAGNPLVIAGLGHELAVTLALARDVPRARAWGEKALPLALKASPVFEGMLRRPLALIYALSGEVAKGEEACEAVVRIERETQLGCIFEDAASAGFFYMRRGQWKRARSYLETTLAKNRGRNVAAYAACLVVLGELEGREGDLKSAHAMLNEALEISRSGGNVLLEIWGLTGLAEAALGMERLDIVDACVGRALVLLDAGRKGSALPGGLEIVRGHLASARREWAEARGHFEQAIAVTRAFELRYDEARAHQGLAMMTLRDGSAEGHAHAVEALRRARGLFQQVGADRDLEAVGGTLARLG